MRKGNRNIEIFARIERRLTISTSQKEEDTRISKTNSGIFWGVKLLNTFDMKVIVAYKVVRDETAVRVCTTAAAARDSAVHSDNVNGKYLQ